MTKKKGRYYDHAMACMHLYHTTSYGLLTNRQGLIESLYKRFTDRISLILKTKYEGVLYTIPVNSFLLFYYSSSPIVSPKLSMFIEFEEIKKKASEEELDAVIFIFEYVTYMKSCVLKYEDEYIPIFEAFLDLLDKGKEAKIQGEPVKYVDMDFRFNAIGSVFEEYVLCLVPEKGMRLLKVLEEDLAAVESKVINDLNLITILGIVPTNK